MKIKTLGASVVLSSLAVFAIASAEGRPEEHGRPAAGGEVHAAAPIRQAPPKFQGHPPGTHPHGPVVRQHPTRVMATKTVVHGHHEWTHWDHAEFSRPVYYWDWAAVHGVSCVAEDTYGDQYPVSETVTPGWGLNNMTGVEDDALDRCYAESGQDPSCFLATCSHY